MNYDYNSETLRPLEEKLVQSFNSGVASVLYARIGKVKINSPVVREAFTAFLDKSEVYESFCIADILAKCANPHKNSQVAGSAGQLILSVNGAPRDEKLAQKLVRNSVFGLLGLIVNSNGFALDISHFGGDVSNVMSKSFIFATEKEAKSLIPYCSQMGTDIAVVGAVTAERSIRISNGAEVLAELPRLALAIPTAITEVLIPAELTADFYEGYYAACAFGACSLVSFNSYLNFGITEINKAFAAALGAFRAWQQLSLIPARLTQNPTGMASVTVAKPFIQNGDVLYIMKPRHNADGTPVRDHYVSLLSYLNSCISAGRVRALLPVGKNTKAVISRLCADKLEFIYENELLQDCFSLLAVVSFDSALNGTALGRFKALEDVL